MAENALSAAGLDDSDQAAFEQVFATVASEMGFDGPRVASMLTSGKPLAEALGLPKGTNELIYARAHASFIAGRYSEAERLFRALTMLAGRNFDYWLGYGICLRKREQFDLARDVFAIAAALRPESAAPYFHMLEACFCQGDFPAVHKALRAYEEREGRGLAQEARAEVGRLKMALEQRERGGG